MALAIQRRGRGRNRNLEMVYTKLVPTVIPTAPRTPAVHPHAPTAEAMSDANEPTIHANHDASASRTILNSNGCEVASMPVSHMYLIALPYVLASRCSTVRSANVFSR